MTEMTKFYSCFTAKEPRNLQLVYNCSRNKTTLCSQPSMGKKWVDSFSVTPEDSGRIGTPKKVKPRAMENNGLEIYFENKRTRSIPNVRDSYNISPIKSQNCYNCVSPILPLSKKKNIYIYIYVSYSSPDLTLYIGCMGSK